MNSSSGEDAWLHFKSLEDSTLEIHLQSPVSIIVSRVPRWTMETLNKEGSKEGLGKGELRVTPTHLTPAPDVVGLLCTKHWLKQ